MVRFTVRRQDLNRGARIEQARHPWASDSRARKIARDNLQQQGPAYYKGQKMVKAVVQQQNKVMGVKPVRRKKAPRPFNPLYDSPW